MHIRRVRVQAPTKASRAAAAGEAQLQVLLALTQASRASQGVAFGLPPQRTLVLLSHCQVGACLLPYCRPCLDFCSPIKCYGQLE